MSVVANEAKADIPDPCADPCVNCQTWFICEDFQPCAPSKLRYTIGGECFGCVECVITTA
jgi:hypothetical protein